MDREELHRWLQEALTHLIVDQWDLAVLGVGERTVTSHLASYLADVEALPGDMRVDHEYNRHEGATKTIRSMVRDEDLDYEGEMRIFPDILVHRRSDDQENWLVIEVKKGRKCGALDEEKVSALLDQYGYRWGALLALGMGQDGWDPRIQWIGPEGERVDTELFSEEVLGDVNGRGQQRWAERMGGG